MVSFVAAKLHLASLSGAVGLVTKRSEGSHVEVEEIVLVRRADALSHGHVCDRIQVEEVAVVPL